MNEQINQLTGLLEDMMYNFGMHDMSSNCCENISHGEFRALGVISRLDRCSMHDIAKSIAVTKSGATRIVKRLEEKKLVRRVNDKHDGRVCCVQLSKEGISTVQRLTTASAKKTAVILNAMAPDMRQILLIGLRAFVETAINQKAKDDTHNHNRLKLTRK